MSSRRKRHRTEVAWTVVPRPENGGPKMFEFPKVTDRLFEEHDGETNKWENFRDINGELVNAFTLMVRADQRKLEETKASTKVSRAAYYQEHKEESKASSAAYYQEHKEELKASSAAYKQNHKEEKKVTDAVYNLEHKERKKETAAAWYQANKVKKKASSALTRKKDKKHKEQEG